ncbi:transposase, partial [Vagococcus silagei]
MSIIQQPTLFDIQILQELEIEVKYQEFFSPLELTPLIALFQKENTVGAPVTINYEAALRAVLVSFLEGIPTIKALVMRIKQDVRFKLSLGFLFGDRDPSEATFSRILHVLSQRI